MPLHTCKRCNYASVNKPDLLRHLQRKKTCVATCNDVQVSVLLDELTDQTTRLEKCSKCNKSFANRSNVLRHENCCAFTSDIVKIENSSLFKTLVANDEAKQAIIKGLEERLVALECRAPVQVNQDITIVLNNFGKEDTSYISEEVLHERLLKCGEGVLKNIEDIHFNSKHPENKNVRMKSIKRGMVEVLRNDTWEIAPLKDITCNLLEKSFGLLMNRVTMDSDYADEIMSRHAYAFEWQMMFRTKEIRNPLLDKAICLLMNNKSDKPSLS